MKNIVLTLLFGLVPALSVDVFAQQFTVEKESEIPIDLGDGIAGDIADLIRDAEGNFYLPDWQQHTVWVVDPQGKLIREIGQPGRGPG